MIQAFPAPVYFLSDCHLPLIARPGQEDWTPRVVRFLRERAVRAASLFLVGDLFDFWFEWRRSVPGAAFPVLAALHELVLGGRQVVFLAGNHDGHPGRFLEKEVGLTVSRVPIDADIDGRRFHIIHGDGLAPADRGYRILRAVIRWKPTEALYRLLHPDAGIWFARQVSGLSQRMWSYEDKFGPEPYRQYARRKLDEGFNYVVMGHRHKSEFIPHPNGGYLAIGEWIAKGTYGVYEDGELKLEIF